MRSPLMRAGCARSLRRSPRRPAGVVAALLIVLSGATATATASAQRSAPMAPATLAARSTLAASATLAAVGPVDFTWSGATPVGVGAGPSDWSNATNWAGGAAPGDSVGILSFPALSSGACSANPPANACYTSHNDVSGLDVTAISIDAGSPYVISGNSLTLGQGGLTAVGSESSPGGSPSITTPITLAVAQTWSVAAGGLSLDGAVTGNANTSLAPSAPQLLINFPTVGQPIPSSISTGAPRSAPCRRPGAARSDLEPR